MATFTSLPTEIRLHILKYLIIDDSKAAPHDLGQALTRATWGIPGKQEPDGTIRRKYREMEWRFNQPAIMIRNINAMIFQQSTTLTWPKHRTCYDVLVRHRIRGLNMLSTTYKGINSQAISLLNAMMYINHQTYQDATSLMYNTFILDFDRDVEAVIPFMRDITTFARYNITTFCIIKSPPAIDTDYTRDHWSRTMKFLGDKTHGLSNLKNLHIGFRTIDGYGLSIMPSPPSVEDFKKFHEAGSMPWLSQLLQIRNLQYINVFADPDGDMDALPTPEAVHEHYSFSESVETSLRTFLQGEMLLKS